MTEQPTPEKVVSKQQARSGETSGHVRLILGVSMSLTVIGMGVLLLMWFSGA